jgi:hypothetical protein
LRGRCRGRPTLPRTGGIASSRRSKTVISLRFAGVRSWASGMPCASVTRWRFVPGRARSVGLGPVASAATDPPLSRGRWRHPSPRAPSPGTQLPVAGPAGPVGARPRRPPGASRGAGASTSCRSRSPSPAGAIPTGCRSSGRRGCPSDTRGPGPGDGLPSAEAREAAGGEPRSSRARQRQGAQPCRSVPQEPVPLGVLRPPTDFSSRSVKPQQRSHAPASARAIRTQSLPLPRERSDRVERPVTAIGVALVLRTSAAMCRPIAAAWHAFSRQNAWMALARNRP